ncbi:MAG: hypothetical protein ABIE68_01580 [bacterium]
MLVAIVVLSLSFGVELEEVDPVNVPTALLSIAIITVTLLTAAGAWWYLRLPKGTSYIQEGFSFGVTVAVLGFIDDIIVFLPYEGGFETFAKYFSHVWFWLAFILIIGACTFVGYLKTITSKQAR